MSAPSEREVRELLERLARVWNRRDWPAFSGHFTADSHYVSSLGKVLKGRDQISTFLLSAVAERHTVSLDEVTVRLPAPDAAIVLCRWTLQLQEANAASDDPPRQGLFTAVLVHEGGAWKITALHNTDIPSE